MTRFRKRVKLYSWVATAALLLLCSPALIHAQATAPASAATAAVPAPAMSAPLDVKAAAAPSADDLAKGDPSGTKIGTINDVLPADANKGVTLADVVNQVGQNRIGINFVWTLITGFLVMFMQAGFAIVETGLCRAKNANQTMMMNFMVYGFGLFAFWVCGFAIQMGGGAPYSTLGGANPLNGEHVINFLGKPWGIFGTHGFFLSGTTYDVGVMVLFLFEMVFMDTALTIVTGAAAERWKYVAFGISSIFMGAITYPLFGNWAWGGGWLSKLGTNYGLGAGYADFAGSGVVHAVGGVIALIGGILIGPRIGKYVNGKPRAIPGHSVPMVC
ncbi:MAG: ammonium transporter, partial [Candidatus Angelobacter sp.]